MILMIMLSRVGKKNNKNNNKFIFLLNIISSNIMIYIERERDLYLNFATKNLVQLYFLSILFY